METSRLKKLQAQIKNPVLIKKKENLFYLTGRSFDLRAEEYLLVTKKDVVGFGSGLESMGWIKKSDRLKYIGKYLGKSRNLDIEWGFSYGEGEYLKFKIDDVRFKIEPKQSPVDEIRTIKEPGEIALIKKSMQIVEAVFKQVRSEIKKSGMTEVRLAQFIQNSGLKMGAHDLSFPAIVASGANAAVPHHVPSNKRLKAGESIIVDFGFKYKNYCSDFTRTVFLKKVHPKLEVAYNQVEKAYLASMEYIEGCLQGLPQKAAFKGVKAGDVYQKSVDVLAEKKLDKYFIHSLGHGTGLEIHELPNLSPNSKDVMANGMVFSIEPGVYLPKLGGIRIEDLVYLDTGRVKKFIKVPTILKDNIL